MSNLLAWFRVHMAHCFAALALLVSGAAVVHPYGLGAGAGYAVGLQLIPGGYLAFDNEPFPIGTPTAIAASTPTVAYTLHASVSSEITDYAMTCTIRYTDADSGVSLDGGVGEWTFHKHVVGGFHGGAFCAQNPAGGADICTTGAALGGIGSYSLDPVPGPDAGLQAGATCDFGWSGSALTVVADPGVVSYAFGWITGQRVKDPGAPVGVDSGVDASDSGTDAADASDSGTDAADASDSGPPPNVTYLWVPRGSQSGGETIPFGGTGFTTSNCTTCSFGGVAGTAAYVSSTQCTCHTPTSGLAMSTTPVLAVMGGSTGVNFYVDPPNADPWYFPGSDAGGAYANDWTVAAGAITTWPSQGASGVGPLGENNGCALAHQPLVFNNYNSGAYNSAEFQGATNNACLATVSFQSEAGVDAGSQPFTMCSRFSLTSASRTQVVSDGISSTHAAETYTSSSAYGLFAGTSSASVGTVTTAIHLICSIFDGTTSTIYVDGTVLSGSLNSGGDSITGITVGASYAGTSGSNGWIGQQWFFPRILTTTEMNIINTNSISLGT